MKPPEHLSLASRKWFREVCDTFDLDTHHVKLLTLAAEALDRAAQAQAALAEAGSLTYLDRFGAPRLRPEVGVKRDAEVGFARLLRELGLDAATEAPRPPAYRSSRRGAG